MVLVHVRSMWWNMRCKACHTPGVCRHTLQFMQCTGMHTWTGCARAHRCYAMPAHMHTWTGRDAHMRGLLKTHQEIIRPVWTEGPRGFLCLCATWPVWTQKAHEDLCVAHEAFRRPVMCYECVMTCAFHKNDNVFHLCTRGPVQEGP